MVQPPSGRGRIRTSRLACARSLRSRSPSGSANASQVRARRSNSSNDWPIASSNSAGESRSNTLAGMRGLAAIRAINSDWATPTRPSASASAHSGRASCRRAVWTRRCASGPDSSTHVLHDRLRRQEALLAERVRPVDHTRRCDRGGLDGATQLLDLFEPHAQLDGVQRRHIDIEQSRHRRRRPTDRITSPISRRFLHDRADKPQPDAHPHDPHRRLPATSSTSTEVMAPS